MDFFDNDKGIVSKVWIDDGFWSSDWTFNLTFYDGDHIDQKFAMVKFSIPSVLANDFNSYAG